MKKTVLNLATAFFFLACFLLAAYCSQAQNNNEQIHIRTNNTSLVFGVKKNKRLYQLYLGEKLDQANDVKSLPDSRHEAYITGGMEDLFEPAVSLQHADGNPSLVLFYVNHTVENKDGNSTLTTIRLKDSLYPVEVVLYYQAYPSENVIKTWTEIKNGEKKEIVLHNYASSFLHFDAANYWLTQYHGDWAKEAAIEESRLTSGIKIIDSKLGTRANKYQSPMFMLSLNSVSTETAGEVIAGTLAWTGNFRFGFELDNLNSLRVVSGINPYNSIYRLGAGKSFVTPEFIFTYSSSGKGQASRNFHRWARAYGVLDGTQPRYTLLNNWEATRFDFNQDTLVGLFEGAAKLGVDLFLLDDGWFGNKYPRNSDKAGLGDWQENVTKLPSGLGYLVKEAAQKGVKFGIWLEPEMVNPKSDLYEKHPDWIIKLPNRQENYQRNQLVLDLTNPQVQNFIYEMVDDMLTKNPDLAYIKWDCNRTMSNYHSPYLGENQSHLFIEYTRSFYRILERLRKRYPHLPIMLCSGGGGRTDYGALKYFQEFWPSDNTDGLERIYIQWGFSHFFPSNTLASHVTNWGHQSLKFRTDVAMMGKLGYDITVKKLSPDEIAFSQTAIKNYQRISDLIWWGDQYRIVSPYEENRAVLMYVDSSQKRAVLFNYFLNTRYGEIFSRVRLQGLEARKTYRIREMNLFPGAKSASSYDNRVYSGDYLMKVGLNLSPGRVQPLTSSVFELVEE
jgi:alpha-galactosidase